MSERSKGDTSYSAAPSPASARIVKNPLLSASVTGLTFDDFQNKPLLLPAAPPIVHPVPIVSNRESTPLVTVGKSSDIDSENLSEINLNDISGTTLSSTADISDENSNSLIEPSSQTDSSILSQAASSFSQLPSVASSVFSSFSKKFNSSGREDSNSNLVPQLDIQPFATQLDNQTSSPIQPPPVDFRNQEHNQSSDSQIEQTLAVDPPTFYSPSQIPPVQSASPCPPSATCQNSYRISAKKKIYAPIPGLSSAYQEQNFPQAATPSFLPPIGFEASPVPVYPEQSFNKPEERKSGLFSLSSFVPAVPNVLQNLSGLVQSAAGSLTQKPQGQLQQQEDNFETFQVQSGQVPQVFYPTESSQNLTSKEQISNQPTPQVNFFTPGAQVINQPWAPIGNTHLPTTSLAQGQTLSTQIVSSEPPRPPSVENYFKAQVLGSTTSETQTGSETHVIPPPIKPPSGGPPSTSFRLQKGTRLYKSPFAVASSEPQHQQIAGYPPYSQNIGTQNQPIPEVTRLFNPLQQGTSQGPVAFVVTEEDTQTSQSKNLPSRLTPETVNIFNPLQQESGASQGSLLSSGSDKDTQSTQGIVPQTSPISGTSNLFKPREQGFAPTQVTLLSLGAEKVAQSAVNPVPTSSEVLSFANPFQQGPATSQGSLPPTQETISVHPIASTSGATSSFNPLEKGFDLSKGFISPSGPKSAIPSAYTSIPQNPPPLNLFNPLQQGSTSSFGPEKLEQSAPTLAPPNNTESITNIFVRDESSSVPIFNVFQPINPAGQFQSNFNQTVDPTPQQLSRKLTPSPESRPSIGSPNILTKIEATINPVNVSNTDSGSNGKILNPVQLSTEEQVNPVRSSQLPPPPVTATGIPATLKEAANFPPPPPQHSFQNKPNSNPYRRGLQSHHPQVIPAPAAFSTVFNPNEQDAQLFEATKLEGVNQLPQQSISTFFTPASSEPSKHFEEILAPQDKEEVPPLKPFFEETLETGTQHTDTTLGIFKTTSVIPQSETNILPTNESTSTQRPAKTPSPKQNVNINSYFATSSRQTEFEIKQTSVEKTYFNPFQTDQKDQQKAVQSTTPVQEASAKIAVPQNSQTKSESQQAVPNSFTSFFEQSVPATVTAPAAVTPVINQPSPPDSSSFFDSFGQVPSVGVDAPPPEDPNSQRIQNFFNNPPPADPDPVGDLNYDLVGSGLSVKNLQIRSLTPASNLVEPPSSSCSDFSELNSSLSAAKQARAPADDSTKVSPEEEAIFEAPNDLDLPEEIINEMKKMASSTVDNSTPANTVYKPVVKHWFYKRKIDTKHVWTPFSHRDSKLLELAFLQRGEGPNLVAVEGGRYDVNILERTKVPVYWIGEPIEVKRCSWFYKASDSKYVPYEEEIADLLEEEYKKASESCEWHKKIPISAGDMVQFHGPTVIVHFQPQQQVDSWGGSTQTMSRPRVVKRDLDDFVIEEGESDKVDHLLFMVHGIGSVCDFKMRPVEEVVDEFRAIALQLVQSHYKNSVENGYVGRVEVLPVSWHNELHSEELGIDEKLKSITLESIPKLRNYANDTLLDILFYTSPMFCQMIINTVATSINSIYIKYKERHPEFRGGVSLAGHSLGSMILFDLLAHQRTPKECEEQNMENPDEIIPGYPVDLDQLNKDAAKHISYKMGPAGTGQPFISYPQLIFQPKKFFALGSPIGMFVTIRGIDKLGLDFHLPTCPGFFNIFHPYDPIAYRLEALVNPDMNGIPPVLIPHHKGRKRMHLELKETMSRVGADLKQRFFDTFKTTFDSVSFLAPKSKNDSKEIDKVLDLQEHREQQSQQGPSTSRSRADSYSTQSDTDVIEIDFPLGKLNDSKRVDYVLQEAPLEFFNEYLFALSSHVCYWESEDTILFVMKEIYNGIGFSPDSQVPQQTMTIERPSSGGGMTQSPTS